MIRSDVETFLNDLPYPTRKVYVYKQEFLPNEYITIEKDFINNDIKDVVYKIIASESTTYIENLIDKTTGFIKYDLLVQMLINGELVLMESGKWYVDIKSYKTDGCECGAFATINSEHHAFWCRKYFK